MATSTAKLRDSLIQLGGVDILEDGGKSFKSTYQIMDELAANWDKISDMSQAAIIEQVAGKRGASFFSSMMTNWKDAQDAYAAALNSAGSAEKENQSYLKSIAGKQAQFKSAFETLSNDFLGSDMVKFGVDAGRGIVQGVDTVINATGGGLGTIMFGGLSVAAVKFAKSSATKFAKSFGAESVKEMTETFGASDTFSTMGLMAVNAIKAAPIAAAAAGVAAIVAGATAIAYTKWDKETDTLAESQEKLNNSITNYNSTQKQIANIDDQISSNEQRINDIRENGIRSVEDSSTVEQLRAQNSQLKVQRQYYDAISKAEYEASANAARAALNNQTAYIREGGANGKKSYGETSKGINKFALALDDLLGLDTSKQAQDLYLSQADYLDEVTEDYVKARDNLNKLQSTSDGSAESVKAVEEATKEFSDLSTQYQVGLSDYYSYLDALTNPETGRAKSGFEKEYQQARNQINKMLRADQGDSQFLNTLLGYGEYSDLTGQLTDMALNSGFAKGWENSSKAMHDFIAEAESAGMTDAASKIKDVFQSITDGSENSAQALALIEDNIESVSDDIIDFSDRYANTAKAAQEGFSGAGLSSTARSTLGARYDSAIQNTVNGARLNYAQYQSARADAINEKMADYSAEIKRQQVIGDNLAETYRSITGEIQKYQDMIKQDPNNARPEIKNKIADLTAQAQQYAQAIQTVQNGIKNLNAAQVELAGLGSKLNTYLDTTSGAYESKANLDTIGDSFAKVKKEFDEGWTSGAQARAFVDLFSYGDKVKATNKEISESFAGAEERFEEFYDVTTNSQGNYQATLNGAKVVGKLAEAEEKLGKSFMDADNNIKMSDEDIANVAKMWDVSTSAASELIGALNDMGYTVDLAKTGKSWEQLAENIGGAKQALDKYTDGVKTSSELFKSKDAEGLANHIQDVQEARHAASQAGDLGGFASLNAELAQTAQYMAQLENRNAAEDNLLGFDTSKSGFSADLNNRIGMLQDLQKAQENLRAGQIVDEQAPGLLGANFIQQAEGEIDRSFGELANYIADNGLQGKFDGLSTDATSQEISDYLSGMDVSEIGSALEIDMSGAQITGTDTLAASIGEVATSQIAGMMQGALAYGQALEGFGLSSDQYSLAMNSDGSFSVQLQPTVDKEALAGQIESATKDGTNAAYGSSEVQDAMANANTKATQQSAEEYGDHRIDISNEQEYGLGGRPELGEATIKAKIEPEGDIDTSNLADSSIQVPVEASNVEIPDGEETQVSVNAIADTVEMPQGDAGTVNVNAVADNVEVPQGDAGTVNVEAVADNVEVPDEAGSVSVSIEAEEAPTYPDQNPQVTYGINAPPPPVYPDQNPSVTYHLYAPAPPSYPNISRTVTYNIVTVGSPPAYNGTANYNGTAHFNGSSYASGNWGTKKAETALVGELGMETVVYGGKFWTVGNHGAEFASIPKGAIVFNHKQTEELFKNGKVTSGGGRGTLAHANGTAHVSGTAYASGEPADVDFAEIKISRLNEEIDLLADSMKLLEKYAEANALAQQELSKVHEAILANEQAYSYYLEKANQVGLDEGHAEKVRNGTIEIEAIGDEDLKKKVDNFKKWYDAAQKTQSAIVKLKAELQEISKIKLDNIEKQFEWWKDWRQAVLDRRDSSVELFREVNGREPINQLKEEAEHYRNFIKENEDRIRSIEKERDAQVERGEILKYSQAWYEASQRCVEAQTEINELKLKIEEVNNTIREANWQKFENMVNKLTSLRNEMDTAYGLVSDMNPFRDNASVNANGKAQLAMLQDALVNAKQEVKNYGVAFSALDNELKKGIISQQEYNEKVQDLRKDQLDAVESVKKYRDAILDLVRDGIEKETEAFEKLVQARQENLRKQKEADDYARNVRDKTKDINALEAQIAALSGDDSLNARAKMRELESKLQEAQEDLDDTRRQHEYDVMSDAYDKELEDFKAIQEEKLNDLDTYLGSQEAAIKNALGIIKDEYEATYDRLDHIAKLYGIRLNESILNPWTSATKAVKAYNEAINKTKSANVNITKNNYVSTVKSKKAGGAYNTSSGLTLTDERGMEAILTKEGVLRQLDAGDTVFNAQQRATLWKLSKLSPKALVSPSVGSINLSVGGGMDGDININYGITIQGNASESTIADIEEVCKQAAEYTKNDMIKTFRKIGITI